MTVCVLCGAEERWIDDGGPPDGWVFCGGWTEPVCAACLAVLAETALERAFVRRVSVWKTSPTIVSIDRIAGPPEPIAPQLLRWLDFAEIEPGTWRWVAPARRPST